jgi:putative SOS response-associated peptidase YedK
VNGYYYKSGEDALKGPFKSMRAVTKEILKEAKECFDESCNCLKREENRNWFDVVEIFQRVAVFRPTVKSKLKLEEVQP